MAKGKLEFDLPEERAEFDAAVKGMDWKCAFEEIAEKVFYWTDEDHSFQSADEALEAIMNLINDERDNI